MGIGFLSMEIEPAKAMHHLLGVLDDWRQEFHSRTNGDIFLKNKKLLSNVVFTSAAFHHIAKHSPALKTSPKRSLILTGCGEYHSSWHRPSRAGYLSVEHECPTSVAPGCTLALGGRGLEMF